MKRLLLFVGLAIVCVALVTITMIVFTKPRAPWLSAAAAGNGYDGFLSSGAKLTGPAPDEKAEGYVKTNQAALAEIHAALKLPCEVPADRYSITNSPLPDLAVFKTVALALRAEGKAAEEEQAYGHAAKIYCDVIHLGQQVQHGPLIARLTGVAIERIGLDALDKVEGRIPANARGEIADRLEALDRERLPLSEVLAREMYFMRRTTSNPIKRIMAQYHLKAAVARTEPREAQLSASFSRLAKTLRN